MSGFVCFQVAEDMYRRKGSCFFCRKLNEPLKTRSTAAISCLTLEKSELSFSLLFPQKAVENTIYYFASVKDL